MSKIAASTLRVKKSILLFGVLLGLSTSAFAEGQFSKNCHGLELKLPYLHAHCKGIFNTVNRTRINIENYVGVKDGVLIWKRHGNLSTNAKLCSLVGVNLGCAVLDANKKVHYSTINLDEHIGNLYGNLVYQGP